ncbi:MAG TPA: DEAD/DEAH box helicase, partial [Planctomycetota bacterium]|nr:DEAD/DEAH box helicase [Planctomycetota bacterium]
MAHRSSDLDLDAPLARLRGIGPASAAALEAAGLSTIRDLLAWFPVRHDEVATVSGPSAALVGQLVRFPCRVLSTSLRFLPRRRSMVAVRVAAHDGGTAEVVFFNQPYRKDAFPPGCERVAEGILVQHGRRFLLRPGELLDPAAPAGPVRLRYPTVPGIAPARLRAWIARALAAVDLTRWPHVALPEGLATEPLLPMREAVRAMHAPADAAEHERARRTLALQQAVALFTVLEEARCARCAARAPAVAFTAALEARLRARIPLQWTADQAAALERIRAALSRPTPMGMLLQGDVGTGKTAVAVWAALAAVASGLQVAFLAPTELLAEQHFAKVSQWLAGSRVR